MNMRPIYTLEEDFQALGVLDEGSPEQMKKQAARKAIQFSKKQAQQQTKFKQQQQKRYGLGDDIDYGDEFVDEDNLFEKKVRTHRMSGAERAKARISSRKYRRKHKGLLKRIRKSSIYKTMKKKLKKMCKAVKGFRRRVSGRGIMARLGFGRKKKSKSEEYMSDYHTISDVVENLRYDTNVGHMGTMFQELAMFAKEVGEGFNELSEDFVSKNVDYGVMAEACFGIAEEAMDFATAIEEHDDDLSVADQQLLYNHLRSIAEELDGNCDVYEIDMAAISLTEGDVDFWDEDEDFDDALVQVSEDEIEELVSAGYEFIDADELDKEDLEELGETYELYSSPYSDKSGPPYTEHPLNIPYGYGNKPSEETFDVMNPLGISRVDHKEKLILKNQLARETAEDIELDG